VSRFQLTEHEEDVLGLLARHLAELVSDELPRLGLYTLQLELALAEDLAATAPWEAERP
jgi:hypothetical protein